MSEIVVEDTAYEVVIDIEGGPTLTTAIQQELQTLIETPASPVVIDLNSGARGEPGSALITGLFYPGPEIGTVGDVFIILGEEEPEYLGAVLQKGNLGWVYQGNIRGPIGGINTVNGYTLPDVVLTKADIGLGNADNTSDVNKPVSTAQQTYIDTKVSKTGAETIADVKTFTSSPVVPDSSFTINKTTGLQSALDLKAALTQVSRRYSFEPGTSGGSRRFVRLATVDGQNSLGGGYINFWLSGTGDYGDADRGTVLVHAGQRNDNAFSVRAWAFGVEQTADPVELYYKQISTWVFEVWAKFADYNQTHDLYVIGSKNGTVNVDSQTTVDPGGLVAVTLTKTADDAAVVHLTGAETIAGNKAFSNVVSIGNTNNLRIGTTTTPRNVLMGDASGYATWGNPMILATAKAETENASTYSQVGTYIQDSAGGGGWPDGFGVILTAFHSVERAWQISYGKGNNQFKVRSAIGTGTNGWNAWQTLANDATVVHLAGTETVTGAKTFSGAVIVPTPTLSTHAATKGYIDSIVDAAPGTLDTLNELAAALGDDANFATTVTNSIATKVSLTGNETIAGTKTFSSEIVGPATGNVLKVGDDARIADIGLSHAIGIVSQSDTTQGAVQFGTAMATTFKIKADVAVFNIAYNTTNLLSVSPAGLVTALGTGFSGNGSALTALNGTQVTTGTVADARLSSNVVLLTGAQTITGVKTFSAAPVVPVNSFAIDKTTGLQTALDAKQPNLSVGASGADWNTHVTNGVLSVASLGTNAPVGAYVFGTLVVFNEGSKTVQTYYPHQPQAGVAAYTRNKWNASDWSTWRPLADATSTVFRVLHGATAGTARPSGMARVEWVGSVAPTNATADDTWVNTA